MGKSPCPAFPLRGAARIYRTKQRSQVLLKSSTSYTISYTAAVPHILQEFWPSPGLLFRPIHPSTATSRLTNLQPCAANSAAVEDGNSPWTIWGLTKLRARAPRPPPSYTGPKQMETTSGSTRRLSCESISLLSSKG